MTVASKLIDVNNAKLAIKGAIEDHGIDLTGVPFTGYAGKIAEISTGSTPLVIGETSEGGYFAGSFDFPGGRYQIFVAPIDPIGTGGYRWRETSPVPPGVFSDWDGMANAALMDGSGFSASDACRALTLGGHNDWHLPAIDVLEAVRSTLFPGVTIASLFNTGGAQAFDVGSGSSAVYWTSSRSGSGAVSFNFATGARSSVAQTATYKIRAVRMVLVS